MWQPMSSAPLDGTEVDLWAWNKRLLAEDPRYLGGLGRPIKRRVLGQRLTGYHFCQTHKCWRRSADAHFINQPHPETYELAFWMPVPEPPRLIKWEDE